MDTRLGLVVADIHFGLGPRVHGHWQVRPSRETPDRWPVEVRRGPHDTDLPASVYYAVEGALTTWPGLNL